MLFFYRKRGLDFYIKRLRHVITFVEFCGRQERISKKQDGSLVGRTPSFRGEYSQLFIHKLCAFLDYSNHKQFFLFIAFASMTSAPPLEKSSGHNTPFSKCTQPNTSFFIQTYFKSFGNKLWILLIGRHKQHMLLSNLNYLRIAMHRHTLTLMHKKVHIQAHNQGGTRQFPPLQFSKNV